MNYIEPMSSLAFLIFWHYIHYLDSAEPWKPIANFAVRIQNLVVLSKLYMTVMEACLSVPKELFPDYLKKVIWSYFSLFLETDKIYPYWSTDLFQACSSYSLHALASRWLLIRLKRLTIWVEEHLIIWYVLLPACYGVGNTFFSPLLLV